MRFVSIRFVIVLTMAIALAGCSFFKGGPNSSQIETAVKSALPAFWDFSLGKTDSNKTGDNLYEINFKGIISPKEDLFAPADVAKEYQKHRLDVPPGVSQESGIIPTILFNPAENTPPPLKLLSVVSSANQKYDVYGKCSAEYIVDKWNVSFAGFDSAPNIQGKPRSAYGADYLVVDSPEANATFDKLVQQQKEIVAKRKQVLDSVLPSIPAGAIYEGEAVYQQRFGDPKSTQKIRITFKDVSPDGKTINVMVSNPDDAMDWTPAEGKINTDPVVDTVTPDSDPTKQFHLTYPLELQNDRNKASRRDQMRSWQYYTSYSFNFWIGIKDGKLVGKGGFDLNHPDFDFQAEKK